MRHTSMSIDLQFGDPGEGRWEVRGQATGSRWPVRTSAMGGDERRDQAGDRGLGAAEQLGQDMLRKVVAQVEQDNEHRPARSSARWRLIAHKPWPVSRVTKSS